VASNCTDRLNNVLKVVNDKNLASAAYKTFKDITPIKSGNARKNTHLNGNTIEADYDYAGVLDAGRGVRDGRMRGSDQAPIGMTKPTIEFIRAYVLSKLGIQIKG
jgi:hypothetical protein